MNKLARFNCIFFGIVWVVGLFYFSKWSLIFAIVGLIVFLVSISMVENKLPYIWLLSLGLIEAFVMIWLIIKIGCGFDSNADHCNIVMNLWGYVFIVVPLITSASLIFLANKSKKIFWSMISINIILLLLAALLLNILNNL